MSRENTKRPFGRRFSPLVWAGALGIILLAVTGIWNFYKSSQTVRKNAGYTGFRIVGSVNSEEEARMNEYCVLLDTGCFGMVRKMEEGASNDEISSYIEEYREYVRKFLSSEYNGIYGYINGTLNSGNGWEPADGFEVNSRGWYQKAIEAEGKTVCTSVYKDVRSGKQILTLSRSIGNGNVMAVDIGLEEIESLVTGTALFEEGSQLIFDDQGTAIAARYELGKSGGYNTGKNEAAGILEAVEKEGGTKGQISYINEKGKKEAVFYRINSWGWVNIVVVPEKVLFAESYQMLFWEAFILLIFIAAMGGGVWFLHAQARRADQTSDVLAALGDMYYAIYLIDIESGGCRIVKYPYNTVHMGLKDGPYTAVYKTITACIEEEQREQFAEDMSLENMRCMAGDGRRKAEMECQRLFIQGYRWVSVSMQIVTRRGRSEAVLAFREIHASKVEEIERSKVMQNALYAAQSANSAKSDFLSKMSHDIRTPMNAIVGFTEIARRNIGDSSKVGDALGKIESSSQYLLRLINDILDMSKIEQKKAVLHEDEFNLREELKKTAVLFTDEAEKKKLDYQIQIDPMESEWVTGDVLRLGQICNNILSNAIKFTPEGGRVTFRASAVPGAYGDFAYCNIEIADTGIGIPEEFLKHLFEPFERAMDSKTDAVEGTGLGMPIVKGLVEMMGGTVEVSSRVQKGTTVSIKIPFKIWKPVDGAAKRHDGTDSEGRKEYQGKRILLVEDNMLNQEIMTELLGGIKVDVDAVENGKEAVERFRADPDAYDMILMDIQMPVMNGYEAARAIRTMDIRKAKEIPIAAMTANAFDEDVRASYEAGMNEHLAKPIDVEQIRKVLSRYFS